MNRLLQNRLVLQLLFTSVAAISLAILSIVLITDAIRNAESVVLAEASKSIAAATAELKQQCQYRASSDAAWSNLPASARDISLRALTQTVLRSYPGIEGGFYSRTGFLGYAFPTHDTGNAKTDVPSAERNLIVSLAMRTSQANGPLQQIVRGKSDLLVLGAVPSQNSNLIIWAMKRLPGRGTPGAEHRALLLSILGAAALISIAGSLATGLSLVRGVTQIKRGLASLEKDFTFRLPPRSDELGVISRSINEMAAARGQLETELRREDRLRALGRLAAAMAHEIRNPLNSIRLTVQLLERKLVTNSIRHEDLRTVRAEVDRLSLLLTDLLDLQTSRQPRPVLQPLLPVIQHCVTLVEQQARMQDTSVLLENAAPDLQAFFDSQQLTQTLVNLLLNAIEASPNGGAIHVRTDQIAGSARIEVRDQGPGLNAEQREHLFEPFFTTKPAGTGLGLAVSRQLMRSQGGDVTYAEAEPGARFVIELPSHY